MGGCSGEKRRKPRRPTSRPHGSCSRRRPVSSSSGPETRLVSGHLVPQVHSPCQSRPGWPGPFPAGWPCAQAGTVRRARGLWEPLAAVARTWQGNAGAPGP